MKTIVLIEDDEAICLQLSKQFEQCGYKVKVSHYGRNTIGMLSEQSDLFLLDVNLPDMDGYELCRMIRERSKLPIIFITVKDDEQSIIKGLESGADDYVVKPFSFPVLKSRVMAQLRRAEINNLESESDDNGEYRIDEKKHIVYAYGQKVELTKTEFELLMCLYNNKGCLVTREQLLESIWDNRGNFVEQNTLSVTMSRLRNKMIVNGQSPIETVRGFGYRWKETD